MCLHTSNCEREGGGPVSLAPGKEPGGGKETGVGKEVGGGGYGGWVRGSEGLDDCSQQQIVEDSQMGAQS